MKPVIYQGDASIRTVGPYIENLAMLQSLRCHGSLEELPESLQSQAVTVRFCAIFVGVVWIGDTLRSLSLKREHFTFHDALIRLHQLFLSRVGDLVPSQQRERRAGICFPLRDLCISGALKP